MGQYDAICHGQLEKRKDGELSTVTKTAKLERPR
jgi:hypothetical protein